MDIKILKDSNPWWSYEEWENYDKHLKDYNNQRIKWIPKWINEISLEPFSLNFVYGVRQIGKSTGIKLLIKQLLKNCDNPFSICYFNFDYVASYSEFRKIIEKYLEIKRKENVNISYMFFDEITSVSEWYKFIKFLIDTGEVENDVITVLGSSSINLIKAPERFPGRRGKGKNVVVLPLLFHEFINVFGYNFKKVRYDEELLMNLWNKYKEVGGFPKAINQHEDDIESFIAGLISEINKHSRRVEITQKIISSLLHKIPSALSYHSIAKDVDISHKTVREYIEFFEDCFVLKTAYYKQGKQISFRKEKKIFFRDPFILRAFSFWTGEKFLESALYECIVQEHLYRKFGEIYYYKNSYEIDCIAGDLKVEVKASKPHRKYPKDVIILEEDDIPRFLIELFTKDYTTSV